MKKTYEWLTENVRKDIDEASNREIKQLYEELKKTLKKYDNDPLFKQFRDFFKKFFKSNRERCKLILEDILEEVNKPGFERKEELKRDLLEISNIHRGFLENLAALFGAL